MTEEEKRQLKETFAKMFPLETAQAELPFYYHDKRKNLIIRPYALVEGIKYAEEHSISSVEVQGNEIDLSPFRHTKHITAMCLSGSLRNVDSLYNLPLKDLYIDNTNNNQTIDLSMFKVLENLSITKNGTNIIGLSKCVSLRCLWLYKFSPKKRNLEELSTLCNLKKLILTYAKIDTLDGIEEMGQLEELEINYSRTLNSVQALVANDCWAIKRLEIDHCPNIMTYSPLASLQNLETLVIRECKTMDTRSFLLSLNLHRLFISKGTKILDEIV